MIRKSDIIIKKISGTAGPRRLQSVKKSDIIITNNLIKCMTGSAAETTNRHEAYRDRGWWPGEALADRYERHVLTRPDGLAVADSTGRELSHEELWKRSAELENVLADRGVCDRHVVLLFVPNRVEWQIAMLAVLRLGAIPASIPATTDVDTLSYALGLVGSSVVLTARPAKDGPLLDKALEASRRSDTRAQVLELDADREHRWIGEANSRATGAEIRGDLDHIMFTSSTTGLPKAVMHTADTLAALNILFAERFCLGPDTPVFMGSPLGHSVGAIHGARLALHTGAALVLQETWDPLAALELIDRYRCSFTAAATPFLKDLLDVSANHRAARPMALDNFLCGGAPVPPALLERSSVEFPDTFVTNLWGMTEGGVVTCVPGDPADKLVGTAGIGLPGLELRILDDDGSVLRAGGEGELAMRGPGVFVGYFGQEDLYRSSLTSDGFFRTGDLATIDDDGYLRITGRLKDLIIRGGVNISPLPTEDTLASHPAVKAVAVVGFPDERLGERICAVVEPAGDAPALKELIRFATESGLQKKQLPEVVRYVDRMPRTAAGKIRKPVLQALIERAGSDALHLEIVDDS